MHCLKVILALIASLIVGGAANSDYKIFCYWDVGSLHYKNITRFFTWDFDPELCTHLIYGSAFSVTEETGELELTDKYALVENEFLRVGKKFKKHGNVEKLIFSVGGFNDRSGKFSKMVGDVHRRDRFFTSIIEFMYQWSFDGIQIDWEFPTQRGVQPEDRRNFIMFLEELKIILEEHEFVLMTAVSGRLDQQTLAFYDIPNIVKYSDFVGLVLHENSDPYRSHLGYNAPLPDVKFAVEHWTKHGQTPSKLVVVVPFFVRSYTMQQNNTMVGAPSKGPGEQTQFTRQPGFMTYGEWCLRSGKWKKMFDSRASVPYAFRNNQWVSYEDASSIYAKMAVIRSHRLAGAMAWSVDVDDHGGKCGERFPLLRVIVVAIGDTKTLTTEKPTTEGIGICPQDGLFRHPWDCQQFHQCRDGQRVDYECVDGYYFDPQDGQCKLANLVKCENNFVTWKPGQKGFNVDNMPLNLKIVSN
ncbi:uncharacterized protein Dwil_GK22945 [Drosophila willistoni]|uniref:Uncharacterized protein n=1 Tax=Drosophila willistoni TaxID=7260 RepID=B4NN72_DROWI|nr:probable chitinase 10 [Drosophila willistoni]EDW85811.1 uncharacterized protein Dwil_GK22945 [Drosophila willistoni]